MKFILGYKPGTKSIHYNGPKLFWALSVKHGSTRYHFERCVRDDSGLCIPVLRVYDTNDYPEDVINLLMASKKIVPWEPSYSPEPTQPTGAVTY